eukprot:10122637-Karenia_brevis.AAC.1
MYRLQGRSSESKAHAGSCLGKDLTSPACRAEGAAPIPYLREAIGIIVANPNTEFFLWVLEEHGHFLSSFANMQQGDVQLASSAG